MKKYIVSAVLLLSSCSFTSAQVPSVSTTNSCAVITKNLQYLSRDTKSSSNIATLQQFLYTRGYLNTKPSGYFGPSTKKAVIAFQADNNLRATPPGLVGPSTRAKIQDIDCNSPLITEFTCFSNNTKYQTIADYEKSCPNITIRQREMQAGILLMKPSSSVPLTKTLAFIREHNGIIIESSKSGIRAYFQLEWTDEKIQKLVNDLTQKNYITSIQTADITPEN
jgi:hypothetical protein